MCNNTVVIPTIYAIGLFLSFFPVCHEKSMVNPKYPTSTYLLKHYIQQTGTYPILNKFHLRPNNYFPRHQPLLSLCPGLVIYFCNCSSPQGDRHSGERLRVSARGTMFNFLLMLRDGRPFLFDAQE